MTAEVAGGWCIMFVFVLVIVFVFVFFFGQVMSPRQLIKCIYGHNSLGSLFEGAL